MEKSNEKNADEVLHYYKNNHTTHLWRFLFIAPYINCIFNQDIGYKK